MKSDLKQLRRNAQRAADRHGLKVWLYELQPGRHGWQFEKMHAAERGILIGEFVPRTLPASVAPSNAMA